MSDVLVAKFFYDWMVRVNGCVSMNVVTSLSDFFFKPVIWRFESLKSYMLRPEYWAEKACASQLMC